MQVTSREKREEGQILTGGVSGFTRRSHLRFDPCEKEVDNEQQRGDEKNGDSGKYRKDVLEISREGQSRTGVIGKKLISGKEGS